MKHILLLILFLTTAAGSLFADEAGALRRENEELRQIIENLQIEIADLKSELSIPRDGKEQYPERNREARKEGASGNKGFLDFNVYYDFEKYSVVTINAGAQLPHNFSYFSLTNYFNDPDADDPIRDTDQFYTEQNLRWHLPGEIPLNLTTQWVLRSNGKNDVMRFGVQWLANETPVFRDFLKKMNMRYALTFHAAQLDFVQGYQWQMEHTYRAEIFPELFDNRVYISGFADHNVGEGLDAVWVTEHQLGVRLVGQLYGVLEYRFNGYRKHDESTLGIGLEYVILF